MKLRSTLTSPFGRKVLVAARHLGLAPQIEVIPADTSDPEDPLRRDNPLGEMPVLILDDGRRLYDSPVILEYLDHLVGGGLILPKDWDERLKSLTLQALADGMLGAAILILYEGRRPVAQQSHEWLERQRSKIVRGLAALEAGPPKLDRICVGTITTACLLAYLDRRKQVEWRTSHPKLVDWLGLFRSAAPAFDAAA